MEPTVPELLLELADAHEVRAAANDSERDKGAADAYKRAAHIVEGEDLDGERTEIRDEYIESLGHASAGDELEVDE